MKDKISIIDTDEFKILEEVRKRKILYELYFEISMLKMWMNSIYRPSIPMNMTHAGTIAKSILKASKELSEKAKMLIDIIESENTDGRSK